MDQLRSLTGLSSHILCSSVLDYSLNKIHTTDGSEHAVFFPVIVSDKVTVMPRLSFPSFLETCFDPVSAIVTFPVDTNFDSV